ncbi:MAG TPA: YegS/Rv2252/BmrU family lipid kinase [Acidimicrobiia bacterium]|nr:YegS/Rv2252/BmrU family lipid kinase [Acidimicrobiia bacterium]
MTSRPHAPRTDHRPERWTAVLNPAAGRGRAASRLARVNDAIAAADLDVAVHVTTDADDLRHAARAAFEAERGVLACGGDGTVGIVAGLAAELDGVLGVVATGSGNDFARHLGLPRGNPGAAVAVVARGVVARVDLGRAESADGRQDWFTTVANAGFDAEANRWANTRSRLTGTPLYVTAVLRTLRTYRPRPVRLTVDDEVTETDAWLVAMANTRSYASGMVIAPTASVHDGLLDVCVVGPVSRAEFLRTFPGVFRGTHVRNRHVVMLRGRNVSIEAIDEPASSSEPLELWASGERVGPLPARVAAVPGALRVVVDGPRAADALLT